MKCHDIDHGLSLSEEPVTEGSCSDVGKHSQICEYNFQFIMWKVKGLRLPILSLEFCQI